MHPGNRHSASYCKRQLNPSRLTPGTIRVANHLVDRTRPNPMSLRLAARFVQILNIPSSLLVDTVEQRLNRCSSEHQLAAGPGLLQSHFVQLDLGRFARDAAVFAPSGKDKGLSLIDEADVDLLWTLVGRASNHKGAEERCRGHAPGARPALQLHHVLGPRLRVVVIRILKGGLAVKDLHGLFSNGSGDLAEDQRGIRHTIDEFWIFAFVLFIVGLQGESVDVVAEFQWQV